MWRSAWAIALAALACSTAARAQDIAPDACFCLRHASGQSQTGCRAEKFPGQFYQTAICRDPETGETQTTLVAGRWTVVMEGKEGCEVCQPDTRITPEVPRAKDDADLESQE